MAIRPLVSSSAFWHARVNHVLIWRKFGSGIVWSFSARALLLPIRLISSSTTSVGEGRFLMSGYFSASFLMRGSSRSAKVCFWLFLSSSVCSYTACSTASTLRSKEGCFEELAPLRSSPPYYITWEEFYPCIYIWKNKIEQVGKKWSKESGFKRKAPVRVQKDTSNQKYGDTDNHSFQKREKENAEKGAIHVVWWKFVFFAAGSECHLLWTTEMPFIVNRFGTLLSYRARTTSFPSA